MAEIILPPEENEETPQAPELNIDKPTENSKVISIEFEAKKTNKVSTKDTNQQLYTTDTDAWFEFKETSLEGANGTYSVVFRNSDDGSIFQRTGDVLSGVAYYKIPHQEIRHAGAWRGQIVYTLSNGDTTAREFGYDVKGHILDGKDVQEVVVEDFETLMSQLRNMKDNAEVELANLKQQLKNTTDTAEQNETDRQAFFDDLVEDIDELQVNYQELLDTGVLQTNINTKLEALEEEYAPKLTEVTAQLAQSIKYVNYEMFKKEGMNDGEVIKNAHEYANLNGLPIINTEGEYFLDEPLNIEIKTPVNWGNSTFHINEKNNTHWDNYFTIEDSERILLQASLYPSIITKLNNGETNINELLNFKNSLLFIYDENDVVGQRFNSTQKWYKRDVYYISNNGHLEGEKVYDFNGATSIYIQPLSNNYLKIEGGHFIYSGETPISTIESSAPTIRVSRGFTILEGQRVSLLDEDNNLTPSNGFYGFYNCYDVLLKNCHITPRKNTGIGSYGIHGYETFKLTLDNVTAQGDDSLFGVMGSNFMKDLVVKNSNMNRIDVHYKAWNVTIKNSKLNLITLTGGGLLDIDRTTVTSSSNYVDFRSDYGSSWLGKIKIRNAKAIKKGSSGFYFLDFGGSSESHDYMETLAVGSEIDVKDVTVDFIKEPTNIATINLFNFPNWSANGTGRYHFPSNISFKTVDVINHIDTNRGVSFGMLIDLNMKAPVKWSKTDDIINTNCNVTFENIKTSQIEVPGDSSYSPFHFVLGTAGTTLLDEYSIVPNININNCTQIAMTLHGNPSVAKIKNTIIDYFRASSIIGNKTQSIFSFENCLLQGRVSNSATYYLRGQQPGYNPDYYSFCNFLNCVLTLPIVDGVKNYEKNSLTSMVVMSTGEVLSNHINTMLTSEFKETLPVELKDIISENARFTFQ